MEIEIIVKDLNGLFFFG